jgi:methanogenic corrinoid protein MtbC1
LSGATERTGYSIAAVSKLTGVSCHALRAWERRYGFPAPFRSPSGHRRYDAQQVLAVRCLAEQVRHGAAIGDLLGRHLAGPQAPGVGTGPPFAARQPVDELADRLVAADIAGAEASYARLVAGKPVGLRVIEILEPALVEVGERWFRGACSVSQEHCASHFIRGKLHTLIDEARRTNPHPSGTAVLGTVEGDRHEGGVLILGALLELAGWRALLLGVDVPVRDYEEALARWHPDALGLSFVLSRNINKRFEELSRLRGAPIFVGGRSILNYQGLARRHGLVPLPGPAGVAVGQLLARLRHPGRPEPERPTRDRS